MRRPIVITVLLLTVALLGCSEKATTPAPTDTAPTVTDPPDEIGILLEANTVPDLEDDPADGWPWDNPPPYDLSNSCDVYAVTFIWGSFFSPSEVNVTDWSGMATLHAEGAVHVHTTIDFEYPEDSLVATDAPIHAAWVSKTSMDIDGLALLLFVRNDIAYFAAPTFTFDTEPISLGWTIDELGYFAAFYQLSDGNMLLHYYFYGYKRDLHSMLSLLHLHL